MLKLTNNEIKYIKNLNFNLLYIMSDNSNTKIKVRTGKPGRPRKNPIREPKPRNGIVKEPKDSRHYIEFLYDKPQLFKKIWQFFKLIAVDKINILFQKDKIIMYCNDHLKKSKIKVIIDCTKVNHYYCENELDICLSSKHPELIMATIDKSYTSILILSTHENLQKSIQFNFTNDLEIDSIYHIELLGEPAQIKQKEDFDKEDYMISFNLNGRYFKKIISDIRSFSDQLTFKQDNIEDPLLLDYNTTDKKVKALHRIKHSNKKSNLKSKLKEDDTFRVSVKIDYIKPISSSILSENIKIFVDENKDLMVKAVMDVIEVKILTQIIDNREI